MQSQWILWCFVMSYSAKAQDPAIVLRQGRLVGTRMFTQTSPIPIETFFGIPYATAPVGRHRFSAPERHPGWRRTLFAHRLPPPCPEIDNRTRDGYFSEDCLFLNICTPRRAEANLLPVVVLLYSKSWLYKGTLTLPCQELAAEGLVVVSVAYRLNLFGFFSLRSRIARGNLALLDQYMALMWIRENIAEFGGDPALVTLLGHSSGADSIMYHMASPRTFGLFQRAIIMSPSDIWRAVDADDYIGTGAEVERSSRDAALTLACAGDTDEAIVQCVQSRSLEDIVQLYSRKNGTHHIVMQPIIDDFLPSSEQYLPQQLSRSLASSVASKTGQIDVLFGTTDLETINFDDIDYEVLQSQSVSSVLEYTANKVVPNLLSLHDLNNSPALPALIEAVLWEYWGPRALRAEGNLQLLVERLGRMKTSARWGAGAALLAAKLARRVARLYVYRYTQPANVDLEGKIINYTGAVHGTDLIALLGDGMLQEIARRRPTTSEQRTSKFFRKYFVNFIKFGSPTLEEEWPQYRAGAAYLHDLHIEDSPQNVKTASREVAFWLQYLPYLSSLHSSSERTESLNSNRDETRLRGAVYALVGVAISLLTLLCICAVFLRRERIHGVRASGLDD